MPSEAAVGPFLPSLLCSLTSLQIQFLGNRKSWQWWIDRPSVSLWSLVEGERERRRKEIERERERGEREKDRRERERGRERGRREVGIPAHSTSSAAAAGWLFGWSGENNREEVRLAGQSVSGGQRGVAELLFKRNYATDTLVYHTHLKIWAKIGWFLWFVMLQIQDTTKRTCYFFVSPSRYWSNL